MGIIGDPDRPPVQLGGEQASYVAGLNAAVATLLALEGREHTGSGQVVDISMQESLLTILGNIPILYSHLATVSFTRWKHANLLDQHVAETTQQWEAAGPEHTSVCRGVPAGVVQTNRDLLCDAHLRMRQAFWVIAHRLAGTHPYPAPSTRLTDTPPRLVRPAPNPGEHNTDVLTRLLGLSPAEIQDLAVKGVIGTAVH